MAAMSIDMNPSGNTATSLGDRQECAEVLPGRSLTVDVTATSIPAQSPMLAYSYTLIFDTPGIAITGQESLMIGANQGSSPFIVPDPDGLPSVDGSLMLTAADIGSASGIHESGSGVLDRLEIEVATDAAPAVYKLSLTAAAHIDSQNNPYPPSVTHDGRIAVGVSCSGTTPIPPRPGNPSATAPPGGNGAATATPVDGGPGPDGSPGTGTPGATDGDGSPSAGSRSPTPSPSRSPSPTDNGDEDNNGSDDDGGSGALTVLIVVLVVLGLVAAAGSAWFAVRRRRGG
jgi:hypothetical protein